MIIVAFDLGRPALVTFDDQTNRDPVEWHRRSEVHRLAGHQLLRLADVRSYVLGWLSCARSEARECERRTHQLKKLAAADRIIPLGRILREFAMKEFLKLFGLGQLFEATPVLFALRKVELLAN